MDQGMGYIATTLDVGKEIDSRLDLLQNVFTIGDSGTGTTDVSVDANNNPLQAGTYIGLDGMPGGFQYDINGDKALTGAENHCFDMGSTQGTLAVGFYQQITDNLSSTLTSSLDSFKKVLAAVKKSLQS